ncbi:tetratricopeptide repeat protein [Pseudovibrio flavus]|uniref:tetratricopeptide repeat protein n=1 Tax=Pseudovibrio flavus TaxID=2529854 RepID=UPI00211BD910|nr:tetratricopeptide repeat protein [Pseudovibrio flavus]
MSYSLKAKFVASTTVGLCCLLGGLTAAGANDGVQLPDPRVMPPSLEEYGQHPNLENPIEEDVPPAEGEGEAGAGTTRADLLDKLFNDLRDADEQRVAEGISVRIQGLLLHSGSATADLLMKRAGEAIRAGQLPLALDLLDGVIRIKPEFVEAWNRRATVHYLREDYGKAIADIERVLVLEPRHFPALTGLGMILRRIEEPEQALDVFEHVLTINPMQKSAQEAIKELRVTLKKQPI